ncbi:MAG: hypothetical protein VKJ04_01005 [Vampirovibrionales bacterium]|nr:hypothetical protein [Vampirovibrionales bacterium]
MTEEFIKAYFQNLYAVIKRPKLLKQHFNQFYQHKYSLYHQLASQPDFPGNLKNMIYSDASCYGSVFSGVKAWQKKWENSKGQRILLVAPKDYSGSFMKWAIAINHYTPYAARLVVGQTHQFGYHVDLVVPFKNTRIWDRAARLFEEADIIHVKDELYWFDSQHERQMLSLYADFMNYLMKDFSINLKPKVFTHYGGYARKFKNNPAYIDFVQSFDARVAMTPDLNYEWFNGYFITHSINTLEYEYSWQDNNRICHSPSTKSRKGTDQFLQAVSQLENFEHWNLDLIQNVSHKECIVRKSQSSLFFDQAGQESLKSLGTDDVIGFYGNSALEAMVYGIPTIAHVSQQAIEGAERAGKDWRLCPVINAPPMDAAGMQKSIQQFINMESEQRRELSIQTRRWVEQHHSYEVNAEELASVYSSLLQRNKTPLQEGQLVSSSF